MSELLKTISEGALGGITFGIYHQYTTNKIMKLNNEKIEIQHKFFMDKHKKDTIEMKNKQKLLNEKLEKLEKVLEKLEKVISQKKSWYYHNNLSA
jgi:hypothetical protein